MSPTAGVSTDPTEVQRFFDLLYPEPPAGYLVLSSVLLVMWLAIFLLFDKQIYMVFTTGQLRG